VPYYSVEERGLQALAVSLVYSCCEEREVEVALFAL
jgi:hypothetical protein